MKSCQVTLSASYRLYISLSRRRELPSTEPYSLYTSAVSRYFSEVLLSTLDISCIWSLPELIIECASCRRAVSCAASFALFFIAGIMKGPLAAGVALGLSSHSSVNAQSLFRKSQEFELSSIKKETSVRRPLCKFCFQAESFENRLIKVCTCPEQCWGHEKCVQMRKEAACGQCGAAWVSKYEREMQVSNAEAASFLQSIEEGTERQRSHASSISESSGEARMRKVIQAATLTPFCRLCGKSSDHLDNKLIFPCQCYALAPQESWTHRGCIRNLLISRQSDVCERCKTPFALGCVKESACTLETVAAQALFLMALTAAICGLLAFVASDEVCLTEEEEAWKWVLVGLLVIVLLLLLVVAFLLIQRSQRDFIIRDIFVLCQKHEIAKITAHSHEWFELFIKQMKALGYIGDKPTVHRSKQQKSVSDTPPQVPQRPQSAQSGHRIGRPVETEGFEENASSGVLQEHSVVKESQVVLRLEPPRPSP